MRNYMGNLMDRRYVTFKSTLHQREATMLGGGPGT
jgi:hypothetical protein